MVDVPPKQKKRLTLKEIAAEADARDKRDEKFAKDFACLEKWFAHFWSTREVVDESIVAPGQSESRLESAPPVEDPDFTQIISRHQ